MKWTRNHSISNEEVMELAEKLNTNPLIARILMNRGYNYDSARIMLHDIHEAIIDPSLLNNAELAATVIAEYCKNPNAEIYVYGDYDCDGVTGTFTMTDALRAVAQCPVNFYIPQRSEGYGLSMKFCQQLAGSKGNEDILVITVDNGITKVEEVAYLKANGIEVIVTDHHVAKEVTPDCIIVDPHDNNQPDTFKHLCGCGVAFKVAQLVQQHFDVYNMANYVFAVAIATLADMMPLSMENIAFVKYGLEQMNGDECPTGIQMFKEYVGKNTLTANDLIWDLAPRVNACGRMNDIYKAAELFFGSEDMEQTVIDIELINADRKRNSDRAKRIVEETNFDNDIVCIMHLTEGQEGIAGVVAGKLLEKTGKPSFAFIGDGDVLTGSGRCPEIYGLQTLLHNEVALGNIVEFGGHDAAVGLKVESNKLMTFKESLERQIADVIAQMPEVEAEEPELIIDEVIELQYINQATYDLINELPYDNRTFKKPIFALADVEVVSTKLSNSNPNNIQFTIKEGNRRFNIWAWGKAELYRQLGSPKRIHIAGSLEINFMNKKEFTLNVVDIMEA